MAGGVASGKGYLKVVASGVGVKVKDFTREVKAGYQF